MIAVTGANGYVGGRILSHLRAGGIDAISLVRRPDPGDQLARHYALGEPIEDSLIEDVDVVVHAAYDASAQGEGTRAVNVSGSLALLDGLAKQGGRMLMISSLSAFEGAHSQYGLAKLELERAVLQRNGIVLRPGLVFGTETGGLFGAMATALSKCALVPMIGGGRQRLFVTHDEHLAALVLAIVTGEERVEGPLFAAHEVPTTLREIAEQIARAHGRHLRVAPMPPLMIQLALRCAEIAHVGLPFRSDSLRSLLNPIPLDEVAALGRSSIAFPPLAAELLRG
jgi:nucleoside-diphosphate-sugar epimerase